MRSKSRGDTKEKLNFFFFLIGFGGIIFWDEFHIQEKTKTKKNNKNFITKISVQRLRIPFVNRMNGSAKLNFTGQRLFASAS